jgi:hypothetical protein
LHDRLGLVAKNIGAEDLSQKSPMTPVLLTPHAEQAAIEPGQRGW